MQKQKPEESLANRLAIIRDQEDLSQEAFSKMLSVSRSAYQHYERGSHDVPASFLQQVCIKLDVNPIWLLLDDSASVLSAGRNGQFEIYEVLDDFVVGRAKTVQKKLSVSARREIIRILADDFPEIQDGEIMDQARLARKLDTLIGLTCS